MDTYEDIETSDGCLVWLSLFLVFGCLSTLILVLIFAKLAGG